MNVVYLIARLLLGLTFTVFGLNGFLHFIPAQMPTGLALQFLMVLIQSHYYVLIFGVQLIGGLMLLTGLYVPLALVALAAVIANILTFHITMAPAGLPLATVALILWILAAIPFRANLMPILARKTENV